MLASYVSLNWELASFYISVLELVLLNKIIILQVDS